MIVAPLWATLYILYFDFTLTKIVVNFCFNDFNSKILNKTKTRKKK